MKKNRLYTILIALLCSFSVQAQVAIINSNINAYNITPQGICQVNVMNNTADMQVTLEARLSNSGNERLITVKTQPFLLKAGMNTILGYNLSLATTVSLLILGSNILCPCWFTESLRPLPISCLFLISLLVSFNVQI